MGTREASRKRVTMAVIFLLMLSGYLALSYESILSAANSASVVEMASTQPKADIFQINQSIVTGLVNTTSIALSRSTGTVPYYIVSSDSNAKNVLGLVYLSTDISPLSSYGYNSRLSSLAYVSPMGIIKGVTVLNNTESWGYLVTSDWLLTLVNHSVFDPLVIGQDMDGISRATYTSEGVVNGVRDAGRIAVDDFLSLWKPSVVIVSPSAFSVQSYGTYSLTAVVEDTSGNVLTGKEITWTISPAGMGILSSATGASVIYTPPKVDVNTTVKITATFPGDDAYLASNGSSQGGIIFSVVQPTVVAISPSSFLIQSNGIEVLMAVVEDTSGNFLMGKEITWTISPAGAGGLSSTKGPAVIYTAPNVQSNATVTISASFSGDEAYFPSNCSSRGSIVPPSSLPPQSQYLLIFSGTGATDPPEGTYEYNESVYVAVTAEPNSTVAFDHWEIDGQPAGSEATITVFMNATHVVWAFFTTVAPPPTYSLVITANLGQTTPSPGVYQYQEGQQVSVNATSGIGTRFQYWKLDGEVISMNSSVVVVMNGDHVLGAVFVTVPSSTPSLLSLIQPKDLATAGAYLAFFAAALLVFWRNSGGYSSLLQAGSVLFIGFFAGRMVTMADMSLFLPSAFPPIFTHLTWYVVYGGVLATSILLGRAYCGYLCPFGSLTSLLNRLLPLKRKIPVRLHRRLMYLKYVVLAFTAAELLLGAFWVIGFEPFQTVFFFRGDMWMVLLAVVFLSLSIVFDRFYCRYICPAGAATALVSQLRVLEIKRWDECRFCRICDRACPEGAIVNGKISPRECLNCRVCEVNYLDSSMCPHYLLATAQKRKTET